MNADSISVATPFPSWLQRGLRLRRASAQQAGVILAIHNLALILRMLLSIHDISHFTCWQLYPSVSTTKSQPLEQVRKGLHTGEHDVHGDTQTPERTARFSRHIWKWRIFHLRFWNPLLTNLNRGGHDTLGIPRLGSHTIAKVPQIYRSGEFTLGQLHKFHCERSAETPQNLSDGSDTGLVRQRSQKLFFPKISKIFTIRIFYPHVQKHFHPFCHLRFPSANLKSHGPCLSACTHLVEVLSKIGAWHEDSKWWALVMCFSSVFESQICAISVFPSWIKCGIWKVKNDFILKIIVGHESNSLFWTKIMCRKMYKHHLQHPAPSRRAFPRSRCRWWMQWPSHLPRWNFGPDLRRRSDQWQTFKQQIVSLTCLITFIRIYGFWRLVFPTLSVLPPGSMPFTMAPFPSGRCVTMPKPGEASYKTCQNINTALSPMTCKTPTSLLLMQMYVLGRLEGVGSVLFHWCSLGCNHQPQPDCDEVVSISHEMTYSQKGLPKTHEVVAQTGNLIFPIRSSFAPLFPAWKKDHLTTRRMCVSTCFSPRRLIQSN